MEPVAAGGAPCPHEGCGAPLGPVELGRSYAICWDGHILRLADGTIMPWPVDYNGRVYDAADRRLPLVVSVDFDRLVVDLSDHAMNRTKRTAPLWHRGGRRPLYADRTSFIAAIHKLYALADQQGWDLRNEAAYSAEWIGQRLEPDVAERTLHDYLKQWGYALQDVRQRRI